MIECPCRKFFSVPFSCDSLSRSLSLFLYSNRFLCQHPSCINHAPTRRNHRKDNKTLGVHIGCCQGFEKNLYGGHIQTCRNAPQPPPPRIFAQQFLMKRVMVTYTSTGRNMPAGAMTSSGYQEKDWIKLLHQACVLQDGIPEHDHVREKGTEKNFLHGHSIIGVLMESTDQHLKQVATWVKGILGIGNGMGQLPGKVQTKFVTDLSGCFRYLSKDSKKPHFLHLGTTSMTASEPGIRSRTLWQPRPLGKTSEKA